MALGKESDFGKLVAGPFLEFGYSRYETHNDFASGHAKGDGKGKHYGAGLLARFDFSNNLGADYETSAN